MAKGPDRDPAFDNPSRVEPKRSHQWFVDAAQPELFPNKKQALEAPNGSSSLEMSTPNVPSWDNPSGFQSIPNQCVHHLFGHETTGFANYAKRVPCPETDGPNASVSLSISHALEDPDTGPSYSGFRKVKINQVKDADNGIHEQKGVNFINKNSNEVPTGYAFNGESGSNFVSVGQAYDKGNENFTLMGQSYNRDANIVSPCIKGGDDATISETYSKDDTRMISFGGFQDAHDLIPVGRSFSSYDQPYNQSSVQTPEAVHGNIPDASNASAATNNTKIAKSKAEPLSRNRPDVKNSRKEAPNSFPSNVRSLISTGMLDGVPVKYVSVSREELRGIIQDSGYRCGCQSCNYSKVLNAYEFERHASCKTKHPNNHIYFENGKTIYQIVQELRSTPESMLFDVIQTAFGAPINQKSFRIWKESFQAATRELQRIYGKEELNL